MKFVNFPSLRTIFIAALVLSCFSVQAQPVLKSAAQDLSGLRSFEGVVEAERQTAVAAQVSGAIVEIAAKAGDQVAAGQLLIRIDAHVAMQSAAANKALTSAAQANLELARKELGRQKLLFEQDYLSQAALDRAEARFKSAEAEAHAQIAQAGAAESQAGFYSIRAPYAGTIAEVPVSLGNMAMPGQPLMILYDPSVLRVTSSVPQSVVEYEMSALMVKLEISGGSAEQLIRPTRIKIMPTVDAHTHTVEIRFGLPETLHPIAPGMFVRVWLPVRESLTGTVRIPIKALVRRAEMTGVYVLDGKSQPLLRQVRIGRIVGGQIEILSGISLNDRVVQDAESVLAATVH